MKYGEFQIRIFDKHGRHSPWTGVFASKQAMFRHYRRHSDYHCRFHLGFFQFANRKWVLLSYCSETLKESA